MKTTWWRRTPPPAATRGGAPADWQRRLYVAAAALLLLPIWAVHRVPSIDGGCHLYNAFVMHHLHDPAYPLLARHFEVAIEPLPNWLIQALLYLLVPVLPLALAEQVMLTLYVALFAVAAWVYAGCEDRERACWAFLALPFAWNQLTHYGFYNFVFSIPLALLAVGLWWRWRDRFGWREALAIHALLLVTYFAHLVSLAEALLAIGVLWLADFGPERRQGAALRRWLLHPLWLLPQLLLPLWFVTARGGAPDPNDWPAVKRLFFLARLEALFRFGFGGWRWWLGGGLALLLLLLVLATLRAAPGAGLRRHPFLLVAMAATALYLFSPGGVGLGVVLQPRLSLYPALLVLPSLAPPLGRRARGAILAAVALVVALQAAGVTLLNRRLQAETDAMLADLATMPRDMRVVVLVWNRWDGIERQALGHAVGYLVPEKGFLDWDDYQANTDLFPVRFRPGTGPVPDRQEQGMADYDVAATWPVVDVVYTRYVPLVAALRHRLAERYTLVRDDGVGQLWLRGPAPLPAAR